MAVRLRQKDAIAKQVASFMKKEGKVLNHREYTSLKEAPVRYPLIMRYFSTWGKLVHHIKNSFPEDYDEITNPKTVVKKAEPKKTDAVKTDTKPKAKPVTPPVTKKPATTEVKK